jgi:hypothetical protein
LSNIIREQRTKVDSRGRHVVVVGWFVIGKSETTESVKEMEVSINAPRIRFLEASGGRAGGGDKGCCDGCGIRQ